MAKDINAKLRKEVAKVQDAKRFEHTLGVAYTAACLAMCHNVNPQIAQTAGLLHDVAKCLSNEKKIKLCKKHNIEITKVEETNPFLLHAKVGAYLAREKYDIKDPDIINAIKYHTTGRPEMSILEKIIFIADYIEPCRSHSPELLREIRKTAFVDLDKALCMILKSTLDYLETSDNEIDTMTQKTFDYYSKERNCS